mmetsp:Transcript_29670/g.30076  ORF Transcript_29670/g.30076 Transcript_29670/m.30076 type:complete len:306 (-) Transcript_29670:110-1027(-)
MILYKCVITCLICIILGYLGENSRRTGRSFLSEFPIVTYKLEIGFSVLPLSIIFVGMISFNNFCLKYVEVSFYNVARCLSLVFNAFFTYTLLGKRTSLQTCLTLVIIILGFFIGIEGEINLSTIGTLCGVISSVFVSLNSVYTSKVLPYVFNDKSLLLYYNNVNASLLFLPFIMYYELETLIREQTKLLSVYFWLILGTTGVMGFAIGLVTVMQVKATSPLTHNISGTAKAAVQSLLAFYIWGNVATTKGIVGILLVILGSGMYTYVQMNAKEKPSSEAPVVVKEVAKEDRIDSSLSPLLTARSE